MALESASTETMPGPNPQEFSCRSGDLDDIVALVRRIPEWDDPYNMTTRGVDHLPRLDHILVVEAKGEPVAFRAGYECAPAAFRCWLAGVIPSYRRRGLSRLMYDEQRRWLLDHGFTEVRTYTRASNAAMVHILRTSGYEPLAKTELEDRKPGDWLDFVKRFGV